MEKSKAARRVLGVADELAAILAEHLAQQRLTGADADALLASFAAVKTGPIALVPDH